MLGQDVVQSVRLMGGRLKRIDIVIDGVLPTPSAGVENLGDELCGVLLVDEVDTAPRCDLRCVRGVPVLLVGPSLGRVMPFADACIDHGATRVSVACPDDAMTYTPLDGLKAWAL